MSIDYEKHLKKYWEQMHITQNSGALSGTPAIGDDSYIVSYPVHIIKHTSEK